MAERIIVSHCTNLLDSPDSTTSNFFCKLRPHFGGQFMCFKWDGESSLDVMIIRQVVIIDRIKDCFHRVSNDHIGRFNAQMSSSNDTTVSFILLCQTNNFFLCRYSKIQQVIKTIYNYLAEVGFRISFMEYNSEDSSFESKKNNKNYNFSAKLHRQIRRYESLFRTKSVINSDKLVKNTNSGKREILSKYRIKKPTKKLKMVTPRCKIDRLVIEVYPLHGTNQHTNPDYPQYNVGNPSTRTSLQDAIRNMRQIPSQSTAQINVRHSLQSLSIDDERNLPHTPNTSSGSLPTPMDCEDAPCTTFSGQPVCHDGASSIGLEADISQDSSRSDICISGRSLDQTMRFQITGIHLYNETISTIDSGPLRPQDIARQGTRISDFLRTLGHVRSPEYANFKDRLDTFSRWPSDIVQTPSQVAEAGFFYTGSQDIVRCFACDGGLKNWDPDDDPWVEHARWFPQCAYVRHEKGEEFIILAQMTTEESDEEFDYTVHAGASAGAANSNTNANSVSDEISIPSVLETEGARLVLSMGYSKRNVALAINDIFKKGKDTFSGQDIADIILEKEMREEIVCSNVSTDYSVDNITTTDHVIRENKHLKEMLQCIECKTSERNILFLPCTHHLGALMFHTNFTLGMIVNEGEFLIDGLNTKVKVIKDYNKKTKYVINDGKCTKITLESRIPRCLPENTTLVENTYFGTGSEKVAVKIYRSNVGGLETYFTVTANGCIPIVVIASGILPNSQVSVMRVYEHSGITVGVKDPSVFDIPAICQKLVTMDCDPASFLHNSAMDIPI